LVKWIPQFPLLLERLLFGRNRTCARRGASVARKRGTRLDAGGLELVDHLLRVVRLGAEDRLDALRVTALQLRRVLYAELFVELDALAQGNQSAAPGVQVGAPRRGAAEITFRRAGGRIARAHFAHRAVAGAALRVRIRPVPGHAALRVQVGGDDVGRGMQIALGMAANEFTILGEGPAPWRAARAARRGCLIRAGRCRNPGRSPRLRSGRGRPRHAIVLRCIYTYQLAR
jgi:hypothetical protein